MIADRGLWLYLHESVLLPSGQEPLMSTFSISADNWTYISEGNANVVLRFWNKDTNSEPEILRIPKVSEASPREEIHARVEQNRLVEHFMFPVFSKRLTLSEQRIVEGFSLSESDIESLNIVRPPFRLHKKNKLISDIPLFPVVQPDLMWLDSPNTLSVEIKPKWGFLPVGRRVSPLRASVPQFTLLQKKKLREDIIPESSEYNPLDLFSREESRFLVAIRALIRNPENNFQVYMRGKKVYGGFSSLRGEAYREQLNTDQDVLKTVVSEAFSIRKAPDLETLSAVLGKPLFEASKESLERIMQVQKLCTVDIEDGIVDIFEDVRAHVEDWPQIPEDEITAFRDQIIDMLEGRAPIPDREPRTTTEKISLIRRFLLSATARDCSFMVTMTDSGAKHRTKILDTDFKGKERIDGYHKLAKELSAVD
jgi:hypothetical protein